MKILQIFNRYRFVGGEELVVRQIGADLNAAHEFREVLFDTNEWAAGEGIRDRLRQLITMAWNPTAIRKVREEIQAFKPDLIVLHNLMPVGSAALYLALVRSRIPIIHYIHNFRPFSVNGYCWGGSKLLPQGLKLNFLPEIRHGAWQDSTIKTAWYALLILLLHALGVYRNIHGWIAISHFMKRTFVEAGIDEEKIRVISHSWVPRCADEEVSTIQPDADPMFLFIGRLTEEKGLHVLLDAWQLHTQAIERGRLVIAGEGPLEEELKARCLGIPRVEFVGFVSGIEKEQLLKACTAMIVPSIWWEPLGLVLYEGYDYGKPVLAARSGGIVDHVIDGKTGWFHEPGNAAQLAEQIRFAIQHPEQCRTLGSQGRALLMERSASDWITQFNEFAHSIISSRAPVDQRFPCSSTSQPLASQPTPSESVAALKISAYLADQNPGYDRSFGISRMSMMVLDGIAREPGVELEAVVSRTSQQAPGSVRKQQVLEWGTRRKWIRLLTDHLHPLLLPRRPGWLHYYPKGYLPLLHRMVNPSVVTIHDTIIQYDADHYPNWRRTLEYRYWSWMLQHTLRHASRIMTVSESSKQQIEGFMERHALPRKAITVTYESCFYEDLPQPRNPEKGTYAIHLASPEPHKRTGHLMRAWHAMGIQFPTLHLVGSIPKEAEPLLAGAKGMVRRPFLNEDALRACYSGARALIFPSEIEGFGLPALEAYYSGTPVCFVRGTSVEEVLSVATRKGGFDLNRPNSLREALDEVLAMTPEEIYECGMILRQTYARERVIARMMKVFRETC